MLGARCPEYWYSVLSVAAPGAPAERLHRPEARLWAWHALVRRMIDLARWHRRRMFLEVRPSNRARSPCMTIGFNEIGRRPNYYPGKRGREDAIVWRRVACRSTEGSRGEGQGLGATLRFLSLSRRFRRGRVSF
jgi:hypothetical protein